jgi:hypothetical protein
MLMAAEGEPCRRANMPVVSRVVLQLKLVMVQKRAINDREAGLLDDVEPDQLL